MNLTFGICWIEDQASDAEVEAVEQAVRASGFEPSITRIEKEAEIRSFALRQEHFHDYELILLDLNLGAGLRGNDLAPNIRQSFRSTPILFYSARAEVDLRQLMADQLVEGAYCVHRDRLAVRVEELVGHLSPALNRLAGMRGLAARVVAECDKELRDILAHYAESLGMENTILRSLKQRVDEICLAQNQSVQNIDTVNDLVNHHGVTSGVLYNEVREIVRRNSPSDEIRTTLRAVRDYQNQVIKRRNILAHALEERTENGWEIAAQVTGGVLTIQDFERYRTDFMANLTNLRKLASLIKG